MIFRCIIHCMQWQVSSSFVPIGHTHLFPCVSLKKTSSSSLLVSSIQQLDKPWESSLLDTLLSLTTWTWLKLKNQDAIASILQGISSFLMGKKLSACSIAKDFLAISYFTTLFTFRTTWQPCVSLSSFSRKVLSLHLFCKNKNLVNLSSLDFSLFFLFCIEHC